MVLAVFFLAISVLLLLVVALLLEILFQIRRDVRISPSSILSDLDAAEDKLLTNVCTSAVQHIWKEIIVSCEGIDYRCRGHALFIPHQQNVDAPTILLVHGNAASAFCFADLFDELSETFNVLAIDLPGFGRSQCPRPPKHVASEFFSTFVSTFLAEMSLNRVYVVAHSFGAYIAAELAVRSPQLVSHLMLLDAAGVFPTLGATGVYWAIFFKFSVLQWHRFLGGIGSWSFFNLFHASGSSLEVYYWHTVTGAADSWGDRAMADYIFLSWNRAYWREPALPTLARLRVPIATGYGKDDDIMPPHQGHAMEDVFGWPTESFVNSGHVPLHGQDVKDVVKYIHTFFARDVGRSHGSPAKSKQIDKRSLVMYQSCFSTTETMRTIRSLYTSLGMDSTLLADVRQSDCRCGKDANPGKNPDCDVAADKKEQIVL